jgi:hypothetical protein
MPKSYAPQVIADSSGRWSGNALRFATHAEAWANVNDLYARWTLVRDVRVIESDDEPAHTFIDGKLGFIEKAKAEV